MCQVLSIYFSGQVKQAIYLPNDKLKRQKEAVQICMILACSPMDFISLYTEWMTKAVSF